MEHFWKVCKSPPINACRAINIGNDEMALLQFGVLNSESYVYKYNSIQNEWVKMMHYPKDCNMTSSYQSLVFNRKNQSIYIYNTESKLIQIDINHKTFNEWTFHASQSVRCPLIFTNNDQLHIIARSRRQHLIFNMNECKFTPMGPVNVPFLSSSSVNMKTRKSMITTSIMTKDNEELTTITEYSYTNNKWINWDIKGIKFNAEIVASKNEEYLVFIGGEDMNEEYSTDIVVYDVMHETFLLSSIRAPSDSLRAVVMRNDLRDELLVFGFINKLWTSSEYMDVRTLWKYSIDLIKYIGKWICFEYVHVIGFECGDDGYSTAKHWRIDIDQLIQSATQQINLK